MGSSSRSRVLGSLHGEAQRKRTRLSPWKANVPSAANSSSISSSTPNGSRDASTRSRSSAVLCRTRPSAKPRNDWFSGSPLWPRLCSFSPYICGPAFTAADCVAYVHFLMIRLTTEKIYGENLLDEYFPEMSAYVRLMDARQYVRQIMAEPEAALATLTSARWVYADAAPRASARSGPMRSERGPASVRATPTAEGNRRPAAEGRYSLQPAACSGQAVAAVALSEWLGHAVGCRGQCGSIASGPGRSACRQPSMHRQ